MKNKSGDLLIPYWAKWIIGIILTITLGVLANELNNTHTQTIKNTENINSIKENQLEIKKDGKILLQMMTQMLSANGITPDTTVREEIHSKVKSNLELAKYQSVP